MPIDRLSAAGLVAGGLLVFAAGCSHESAGRPPGSTAVRPDNDPPTINADRLAYDPHSRTVHFYDLVTDPETGRRGTWEVWLPDGTTAYPSGKTFQVARGVDETGVVIKACDPPGPPSAGVKLTDVPRKKSP
jgi:hypothetical protein